MNNPLYTRLIDALRAAFPDSGEAVLVRAPGRVNIIGEHTDYNGLPVLPAAVDKEIAIALDPIDGPEVTLRSLDAYYPERRFTISANIEPGPAGDWGNYAKAAAQALFRWAVEHSPDSLPLKGFRAYSSGTIPAAAGLSSSSAFVVAVAVALVEVNALPIDPEPLAALMAGAERYVGTEGGGMDQAASLLSKPGQALKIDFDPLRTLSVPLPEDVRFIVANSMVVADKAGSARLAYNTRVAECRLGVRMLTRVLGGPHPRLLGDIYRTAPDWRSLLDDIPDGPLSLAEVAAFCGVSEEWLLDSFLTRKDGARLAAPADRFQVRSRCRHVFSEAERVDLAVAAMRAGSSDELGRLMNESHASCADDYEISCPELDELVSDLRQGGAIGARLTGAGFGGCTVAIAPASMVDSLLDAVWQDYYCTYLPSRGIATPDDRAQVLFSFQPSAGAGVVTTGRGPG